MAFIADHYDGPTLLYALLFGVDSTNRRRAGRPATICVGWLSARLLGQHTDFGVLTGGAVAICGASAALAISAVLPKHENSERDTLLTVVGVTGLSTGR